MQIVHNITQVITEFLLVDEDGNVIDRRRGQNDIQVLKIEEFEQAFNQLIEARDNWRQEVCPPDSE